MLIRKRAADRILRERLDRLGLRYEEIRTELLGANACHGIAAAETSTEIETHLPEVVMRVRVLSENRAAVERFTREIAPLVLNGPPGFPGWVWGVRVWKRSSRSGPP